MLNRRWVVRAYDAYTGEPAMQQYFTSPRYWMRCTAEINKDQLQRISDQMMERTSWRIVWQVERD